MARPRRQAGQAWQPATTTIEPHFGSGLVSDADAGILAPGQTVEAKNWMMDKAGKVYKRGGSTLVGTNAAGTGGNIWVAFAEFPAPGMSEVLAWNSNLHLLRLVGGTTWTDCGVYGTDTGYAPRMKPVVVADVRDPATTSATDARGMLIWGVAAGNDAPRVYEGQGSAPRALAPATHVTSASGATGRYAAFYKGRLLLASSTMYENRMWFSPDITTGIETAWDVPPGGDPNRFIDFDYNITGLAALQNIMLVFSRNHTVRLTGSAPPPGGNMAQGPLGDVGCSDSRSIAVWNDAAIWASTSGVFMSNGTGLVDLTLEGGIKSLWASLIANFDETLSQLVGTVWRNFYLITVQNAATLILDIPRRVWWQVEPSAPANCYAPNPLDQNKLYVADGFPRIVDWGTFFTPSSSYRLDVDGEPPVATLTTRVLHDGQVGLKAWRDGALHNRLVSAATEATLTIMTSEANDTETVATFTVPEGLQRDRTPFELGGPITEGIQLTIAQESACDLAELFNCELDYRPLPLSRGGGA